MILENELAMLILCIGVFFFTLSYRTKLKRLREQMILLSGFYLLLASSLFTVLEGVMWPDLLNFLEHACYACSSILLTLYCWRFINMKRMGE